MHNKDLNRKEKTEQRAEQGRGLKEGSLNLDENVRNLKSYEKSGVRMRPKTRF